MKVLEIASLSKEVIAEFGKCIFFVKGDKNTEPAVGAYSHESRTIYGDHGSQDQLEWFTHLLPVDSLHE